MEFLTFLEKYENQNVSKVRQIIEKNDKIESAVISKAFDTKFPSKKQALFMIESYFTNKDTVPEGIDHRYVIKNLDKLKSKVESLTEGDIKIIIHNHDGKKDGGSTVEYEEEGVNPTNKRKRGRPAKINATTYSVPEEVINDEVEAIVTDADIDELGDEDEESLIEQLTDLDLTEEELKSATDMVESGTIDETKCSSKVGSAVKIIEKLNKI